VALIAAGWAAGGTTTAAGRAARDLAGATFLATDLPFAAGALGATLPRGAATFAARAGALAAGNLPLRDAGLASVVPAFFAGGLGLAAAFKAGLGDGFFAPGLADLDLGAILVEREGLGI